VTYVNYSGAQQDRYIPRREVILDCRVRGREAVATGVLGLDLGLGAGFEGDWEELPLCSKV